MMRMTSLRMRTGAEDISSTGEHKGDPHHAQADETHKTVLR
jgi:hypothetical protein